MRKLKLEDIGCEDDLGQVRGISPMIFSGTYLRFNRFHMMDLD